MSTPFSPGEVEAIRAQFPGLQGMAHGKPFVYLDSAATAQKPPNLARKGAESQRRGRQVGE